MENLSLNRQLNINYFHNGIDLALRNERRPIGRDFFDLGPPAGETRDRRRAGQNQRRNLFRETLYSAFVVSPHAHAQLHLRQILRWRACQGTMRRVRAHKLSQYLVEAKTKSIQSSSQDLVSRLRLVVCIRPGVNERADGFVARRITDRDFEKLSGWSPLDSIDANTVAALRIRDAR